MFVLGLTGSIGMGKTTAAAMFRCHKVPVYDADAGVHQLLGRGGAAVPAVGNLFPAAVCDDGIDRETLGKIVFNDPQALGWLESILHPLVGKGRRLFFVCLLGSVDGWSFWIYLCYLKQAPIRLVMLWLLFPRRFTCRACACLAGRVCLRRNSPAFLLGKCRIWKSGDVRILSSQLALAGAWPYFPLGKSSR